MIISHSRLLLSFELTFMDIHLLAFVADVNESKSEGWVTTCLAATRRQVTNDCLLALKSSVPEVSGAAAQAIAAIGVIGLTQGEEQEAAMELLTAEVADTIRAVTINITDLSLNDYAVPSLLALRLLCEGVSSADQQRQLLRGISDGILTAAVAGMSRGRSDIVIKAAVQAMRELLKFTTQNFEAVADRNVIMQTVCSTTQSLNTETRACAFDCLREIVSLYYGEQLVQYMPAMLQLTLTAIKTDSEPSVVVAAADFWAEVAHIEARLEDDGGGDDQDASASGSMKVIVSSVDKLLPLLLEVLLARCPEGADYESAAADEEASDDLSPSVSPAGLRLVLLDVICGVSKTLKDAVLPLVLPFVVQNIGGGGSGGDRKAREVGMAVLGAIAVGYRIIIPPPPHTHTQYIPSPPIKPLPVITTTTCFCITTVT